MFTRRSSTSCTLAGAITTQLLLSFLALSFLPTTARGDARYDDQVVLAIGPSPIAPSSLAPVPPSSTQGIFTLRQVYHHGTNRYPTLHRKYNVDSALTDVWLQAEDGYDEQRILPLKANIAPLRIHRLVDRRPDVINSLVARQRERGYVSMLSSDAWTLDDIAGPNVTDKNTILSLALMAANAYVEKAGQADWEEVGTPYNKSADFGWESDGLRGHVWADETNSTVVIGLKGTSPAVFDGDGTTTNDKVNDNLLFSCCCAQQGPWTWHQVCDCATGTYSCNNTCVSQALREENRYYQAGRELYANVTELYPKSNIWLAGHSLGGAISSLLGLTYGVPVVTFEAVPEALPAGRLGLPVPPGSDPSAPQTRAYTGAFHFGHTADPVYIGTCNGATASCSFGGYAMESACHTGRECVYDTVGDKGWRVGIGTHKIRAVINDVILKYPDVPECKFTPECRDCGNWKMYERNETAPSTTSTSSTSTKTRTRTETCKTPGWWGCLDKPTSTTATSTSTTTTSTCMTPGWFGCKDKTSSTTATITTTSDLSTGPVTTTFTSCLTPGRFWGCDDLTTITSTTTPDKPTRASDRNDKIEGHMITSPPPLPAMTRAPSDDAVHFPNQGTCQHRNWLGQCKNHVEGAKSASQNEL